jgi:hypothetical protein
MSVRLPLLARVVIAALAVLGAAGPGAAEGVLAAYVSATPPKVARSADTVRQRLVSVDTGALSRSVGPAGMGAAQARIGTPAVTSATLTVELFPGTTVTLSRTASYPAFGGGTVWIGRAAAPAADGTLVVRNGRITGTVSRSGRVYDINPVGSGTVHLVREINVRRAAPTGFELRARNDVRAAPSIGPLAKSGTAATTPTEITVLIGYTDAAYGEFPNMRERANLAVALANQAFIRSLVNIRYRLVGLVWAEYYDESRLQELEPEDDNAACPTVPKDNEYPAITYQKNLKYLANGCGYLDVMASERDRLRADLVTLFVRRTELCSFSFGNAAAAPVPKEAAYSVVSTSCIPAFSYSRATGFNHGLLKDRFVVDPNLRSGYRFGYVDLIGKFRDIMSEEDRCKAAGIPCELVNRFSNPAVSYRFRRFGVPIGMPYQADAATFLNQHRGTVAAYR